MNYTAIKENINMGNDFSTTEQLSLDHNNSSLFNNIRMLLSSAINTVRKESPVLFWIVIVSLILALGCIPGMVFDDRMVMGISAWLKPFKFSISTAIYIFTLGYFITFYPYSKRKKWIINGIVSWTLLFELGIIVYQGARGVQSHYNMSSPFDGMLFAAMGILIAINVLIMIMFIIDTIRLKLNTEKSIQWAILIGWIVVVLGSWIGGQMISQVAHNIGVADGGEGLPFLNWSTIAGDLRVAHFFGLHGLQIIPLFALWFSKKWNTTNRNKIIAVTVFGLIYAGWIGYTFYQAKQGIALLSM